MNLRRLTVATVFLVGLALVVFSVLQLYRGFSESAAARAEYEQLRSISIAAIEAQAPEDSSESDSAEIPLSELAAINPDFVGWITIFGTSVNYPVVRGIDNKRYLHTTFGGARNSAGAIFMDYRVTQGFDSPVSIIYGHNMRNGSMFATLLNYLNREFLEQNSEILIITVVGERLVYRIFEVRRTDAWDRVYLLDFSDAQAIARFPSAPMGAERILVLSTCSSNANRNERLLIFAALTE